MISFLKCTVSSGRYATFVFTPIYSNITTYLLYATIPTQATYAPRYGDWYFRPGRVGVGWS